MRPRATMRPVGRGRCHVAAGAALLGGWVAPATAQSVFVPTLHRWFIRVDVPGGSAPQAELHLVGESATEFLPVVTSGFETGQWCTGSVGCSLATDAAWDAAAGQFVGSSIANAAHLEISFAGGCDVCGGTATASMFDDVRFTVSNPVRFDFRGWLTTDTAPGVFNPYASAEVFLEVEGGGGAISPDPGSPPGTHFGTVNLGYIAVDGAFESHGLLQPGTYRFFFRSGASGGLSPQEQGHGSALAEAWAVLALRDAGCELAVTQEPVGSMVCSGREATLSVGVSGAGPLAYQWRRNGTVISPAANPSATTAVLVIPAVTYPDAGMYDCIITSPCGSVASGPAQVTVVRCCAVDWNGDQAVTSVDISSFLASWLEDVGGGTLTADFNHDMVVNSTDIAAFVHFWIRAVTVGC